MANAALIGLGKMGAPMACHLAARGHRVRGYNRTFAKALALADKGVQPCETIADAVADADFIFTIVGYPADVEAVYFGPGGIFESARAGAVAVDMTTSSPELAVRLAREGEKRGIAVLDAPVSGGDKGAREATLTIMVGGDENAYQRALPLLSCMGKSVWHMGGAGAGQHTKACNQIAVAGATAAYAEALAYAARVGLDAEKMLAAIAGGAAGSWQMDNMAPRALAGDFAPGFCIGHFIKDMRIASRVAGENGLRLPVLDAVLALYESLALQGDENEGTQALIKAYRP